jgi:hypothetical protein
VATRGCWDGSVGLIGLRKSGTPLSHKTMGHPRVRHFFTVTTFQKETRLLAQSELIPCLVPELTCASNLKLRPQLLDFHARGERRS